MINIIAAIGKNRELGNNNGLLWHLREDMERFKILTTGHPVIMGRKTFESIPAKFRPLPNRTNIVITRNPDFAADQVFTASSLAEAIAQAKTVPGSDEIFIIGGGQIYTEAITNDLADRLYLTIINQAFPEADVFFPEYQNIFTKENLEISREKRTDGQFQYTFLVLDKEKLAAN